MHSSNPTQMSAAEPPDQQISAFLRPARALLGWLAPDQAHQLLTAASPGDTVSAEDALRARSTREFASCRTAVKQQNVVKAPPTGIGDYLAAFRQKAQNFFDDGFKVCMVDLSQLYALQPTTFTDYWTHEVEALDRAETRSIAEITLPTELQAQVSFAGNPQQKIFTLSSPNLNLQVVAAEIEQNPIGLGLKLQTACPNSVLQVAHYNDRYFCRDGHTRALQLLKRGITVVPAVIKEFSSYQEVAPGPNLLPEAITLGSNPPTLADFLDERVSAEVRLPVTRKLIVVSVAETEMVF
jgi:hypothetical protein